MINDREFGATEAVSLEKDKLQIADMDYVVKVYLEYLYQWTRPFGPAAKS